MEAGGIVPPTRVTGQGLTPSCDEIVTVFPRPAPLFQPYPRVADRCGNEVNSGPIVTSRCLLRSIYGTLMPKVAVEMLGFLL